MPRVKKIEKTELSFTNADVKQKLDQLQINVDQLQKNMDQVQVNMGQLQVNMDQLQVNMDQRFERLEGDSDTIQRTLQKLISGFLSHEDKLEVMEVRNIERHRELMTMIDRVVKVNLTLDQERLVMHHQNQNRDERLTEHDHVLMEHDQRLIELEHAA